MGASSVKPTAPYIAPYVDKPVVYSNNPKEQSRKATLNKNIARELSNFNKLSYNNQSNIIAKETNPRIARSLSNFRNSIPGIKAAIIEQKSLVPIIGGRMKTRKHKATKKAHKRRHSRRN
jgi:hypothetical protein